MVGAYHPESSDRANKGPDLENMTLNPTGNFFLCYVDQNLPTKSCYEHTANHQTKPSNDACESTGMRTPDPLLVRQRPFI